MTVTPDEYRRTIGRFATGVSVVTTIVDNQPRGMTASSVTSVSLDPVLILVCIEKTASMHALLGQSRHFAVNILSAEQEHVSRLFALREGGKPEFAQQPYHPGKLGMPVLDGVLAYLECDLSAVYPGGDHDIFLGEVRHTEVLRPDGEPLIFYRGRYGGYDDAVTAGGEAATE